MTGLNGYIFKGKKKKIFSSGVLLQVAVTKNQQTSGDEQESIVSATSFSSQLHVFYMDTNVKLSSNRITQNVRGCKGPSVGHLVQPPNHSSDFVKCIKILLGQANNFQNHCQGERTKGKIGITLL